MGSVKTEASGKTIPLDDVLVSELLAFRAETPYAADSDYVFCELEDAGTAALLGEPSDAAPHQAGSGKTRHAAEGISHSSSQLHDVIEAELEQPEGCPGSAEA